MTWYHLYCVFFTIMLYLLGGYIPYADNKMTIDWKLFYKHFLKHTMSGFELILLFIICMCIEMFLWPTGPGTNELNVLITYGLTIFVIKLRDTYSSYFYNPLNYD